MTPDVRTESVSSIGRYVHCRFSTLYPALHKLEQERRVESYEQVENGRTRRYYRITHAGRRALAEDREEWRSLSRAVSMILKEA